MATFKQKLAATKTMENYGNAGKKKPKPMGKILQESGYGKGAQKNPKIIVQSIGFQDEIRPLLMSLKKVRDAFLKELETNKKRISKGRLDHLVKGVESFSKLIELLEGRPTERGDFPGWTYEEIKKYADTGIKPERFRNSESGEKDV